MTKKKATHQAERMTEKRERRSSEELAEQKRAGVTHIEDASDDPLKPETRGEHYHVEPERSQHPADPGDVEEQTLDRDAPYNRSYGR